MLGIIKGLAITIEHFFKPKVTQLYPYVKPKLPERSRGLIQLVVEQETGFLRCEACLMCEKVCPPRAITIGYGVRDDFRKRPLFRTKTVNGFYRKRTALTAPYAGKIVPLAFDVGVRPSAERPAVQTKVEQIVGKGQLEGWDPLITLKAIQDEAGYVTFEDAKLVSAATNVDVSDLYSALTLSPEFRVKPEANV